MIDKLPFELSTGVTATREGLFFRGKTNANLLLNPAILLDDAHNGMHGDYWLDWPSVAKRLSYREGEPYCEAFVDGESTANLICEPSYTRISDRRISLHRIAAILCDDPESFQILHWCINNLGGRK